jgi:hypothetical protein
MITKLARSPASAERKLASSRIKMSGFLNRLRNCSHRGGRQVAATSLRPNRSSRRAASPSLRPPPPEVSASSSPSGRVQKAGGDDGLVMGARRAALREAGDAG